MKTIHLLKASAEPLAELKAYLKPFALLFRRSESRHTLERNVTGLLTELSRKNCGMMAHALAQTPRWARSPANATTLDCWAPRPHTRR